MLEKPKRVDLKLPRSWNQCTTEQLETIAACIIKHTATADRFHPFDWQQVKTEIFFLLTNTEIISSEERDGDTLFLCQKAAGKKTRHNSNPVFGLYSWQVLSFIEQNLKWIDDEKQSLLVFPYRRLLYKWEWRFRYPFFRKRYFAPSELMQDFTWQQYRHMQDYMSLFVKQQNALMKVMQSVHDVQQVADIQRQMLATRNAFLSILFHCERHPRLLRKIGEIQWQVVLIWWGGMMHYLQQRYPRCFKSGDGGKKKKRPPNPLELYVSITATMQKYIGLDEEKVNGQTFHVILEQLERIAKENEEMEKINKKHKHK